MNKRAAVSMVSLSSLYNIYNTITMFHPSIYPSAHPSPTYPPSNPHSQITGSRILHLFNSKTMYAHTIKCNPIHSSIPPSIHPLTLANEN